MCIKFSGGTAKRLDAAFDSLFTGWSPRALAALEPYPTTFPCTLRPSTVLLSQKSHPLPGATLLRTTWADAR
jgi:hypothetical protein